MKRFLALALLIPLAASAQTRRHAALPPAELSASAWLAAHAHPRATTDAVGSLDDLEPLRPMVGNAPIVALADGTHGTQEYFTSKLRLIEFLVTRMGFDTLAIEGSFSQMDRVNSYVQGGAIDLRTEIFPHANEIDYHFWAVEEFIDVANWMRMYNLTRGDRPPISVVGIDLYDGDAATAMIPNLLAQQRDDPVDLTKEFDALLYVRTTSPTHPLPVLE